MIGFRAFAGFEPRDTAQASNPGAKGAGYYLCAPTPEGHVTHTSPVGNNCLLDSRGMLGIRTPRFYSWMGSTV